MVIKHSQTRYNPKYLHTGTCSSSPLFIKTKYCLVPSLFLPSLNKVYEPNWIFTWHVLDHSTEGNKNMKIIDMLHLVANDSVQTLIATLSTSPIRWFAIQSNRCDGQVMVYWVLPEITVRHYMTLNSFSLRCQSYILKTANMTLPLLALFSGTQSRPLRELATKSKNIYVAKLQQHNVFI